MKWLMEKKIFL